MTAGTPPVSQVALNVFSALLEARTGQRIASYRSWRIDTALKPLLRDRKLDSFDQLVGVLLDGQDQAIGDQIVDALLNQETSFFRDAPVFDLVVEAIVAAEAAGRRPRIWCAGCSTGQEPLSLAMVFAERAETGGVIPEIIATDVSDVAIARARAGRFTQFEIQRGLPIRRMMRWFDSDGSGDWVAKPDLTRLVAFRRHNLVADRALTGTFDLVLCRNVLLYLSTEAKAGVFDRFAAAIRVGGSLVLGAGETVIGQTAAFEPSRTLRGLYDRTATAAAKHAA